MLKYGGLKETFFFEYICTINALVYFSIEMRIKIKIWNEQRMRRVFLLCVRLIIVLNWKIGEFGL